MPLAYTVGGFGTAQQGVLIPDEPPGASTGEPDQSVSVSAAEAAEYRDRLAALVDEIAASTHDPDGVPIRVLAAFHSPADKPTSDQ